MRRLVPPLPAHRLVLADALCILVFTCIGMLSHDKAIDGDGLLRDTVPLLGGWLVAATLTTLYRRPSPPRLAATWVAGVVGGVLVRALALGRDLDGRQAAFLVTTLCFSALLIGGARLLLSSLAGAPVGRGAAGPS